MLLETGKQETVLLLHYVDAMWPWGNQMNESLAVGAKFQPHIYMYVGW